MKTEGVPKLSSFNEQCAYVIGKGVRDLAEEYKIDDYVTLFKSDYVSSNEKIRKIKKSISEDCPVVIAMHLPKSFFNTGEKWIDSDVNPDNHGYHAMCVIGYDDNENGGSFHIMNSWGPNWGKNGFVWVRYNDFAKYVDQAYEMYVKKNRIDPQPNPTPNPITKPNLSGEISLQLSTGENMKATLYSSIGIYKITGSYISGTRYRIYISNNEPAYVYVISSDNSHNVNKIFPPTDNISAALTYKANHIAIPDETYFIEMDNTVGIDQICVLYSKDKLDINNLISEIKNKNDNLYNIIHSAINNRLASDTEINYSGNVIRFDATTTKSVVPIILEINHK